MRYRHLKDSRNRGVAESRILAQVEDILSTLSRIERAPELSEDLHRKIAGTRVRRNGWAWAASIAVIVLMFGAIMLWTREQEQMHHDQVASEPVVQLQVSPAQPAGENPIKVRKQQVAGVVTPALQERGSAKVMKRVRRTNPQNNSSESSPKEEAPAPTLIPDSEIAAAGTDLLETDQLREDPSIAKHDSDITFLLTSGQESDLSQGGLILILGEPEPVLPSGSYYAEVTLADGARSVVEQTIERDAAGRPQMIRIAREQIKSDTAPVQQGG